MQFYKKRDFGSLVGDSLMFFKEYGRNFFKNYITVNGVMILLLLVVVAIGYGDIIKQLFGGNTQREAFLFQRYFAQNPVLLSVAAVLTIILMLLIAAVTYSFPILYMKRLAETGNRHLKAGELLEDMKQHALDFAKFLLVVILIFTPVFMLGMMLSMFLAVFIIGFLLLLVLIPVFANIANLTLFNLYHTHDGLWRSFSKAFNIQFSKGFWKYTGSTLVLYFMIQTVSGILVSIPVVGLYIYILASPQGFNESELFEANMLTFLFAATYLLGIFLSIILSNIIYINTGLIYYDSRYDLHREVAFSEIENIGLDEK